MSDATSLLASLIKEAMDRGKEYIPLSVDDAAKIMAEIYDYRAEASEAKRELQATDARWTWVLKSSDYIRAAYNKAQDDLDRTKKRVRELDWYVADVEGELTKAGNMVARQRRQIRRLQLSNTRQRRIARQAVERSQT